MGLFDFGNKDKTKIKSLIKEKNKKDKEIEKKWEQRANLKYNGENLKAAKKDMIPQAMTIDSLEYEKISQQLKERLNK